MITREVLGPIRQKKIGIRQRNVWKENGGWGPKLGSHEIAVEVVALVVVV